MFKKHNQKIRISIYKLNCIRESSSDSSDSDDDSNASDTDNSDEEGEESDSSIPGDPGAAYGGYGMCYNCGKLCSVLDRIQSSHTNFLALNNRWLLTRKP